MNSLSKLTRLVLAAMALALPCWALPSAAPDPAAEFMPFVNSYLEALTQADYEKAVEMTDLRGMINYLISRRLADLKAANPDMTAEEEQTLVEGFREKEVNPERVKAVLTEMAMELKPEGASWGVKEVKSFDQIPNAYLLHLIVNKPGEQPRAMLLGIQKIGQNWYATPHLIEQIAAANAPKPTTPPPSIVEFGNFFWNYWKDGELEKAHGLFTPDLQQRLPLLPFLQNGQKLMSDLGLLNAWKLSFCGTIGTNRMMVSYNLDFLKGQARSNVGLLQTDQGWLVEGFQLQRTDAGALLPPKKTP